MFFGKLLITVGVLLLLHAGYYSVKCTSIVAGDTSLGSLVSWNAV
jgi:hypothetical protein